jgi:outer membrane protein assembly factor BamB
MTRRLLLAWVGLVVVASVTRAQMPFSKDLMLTRAALGRIGLEQNWTNVIPIGGRGEKVLEVSIDDNLVFAQTNLANFHVFDSESGRLLWSVNLGRALSDAQPASANSYAVFVSNSNQLFALDRIKGRVLWEVTLDALPSCPTVADEERVWVGLLDGKLVTYNAKTGKYLYNAQTGGEIASRPHPGGRIIAFASKDGRLYASRADFSLPLYRWTTGGPVVAPLGAHGTRTLLVPSTDKSLYAVDLFTGETKWNYPTGAPVEQEPLVAGDDVFVVNREGILASINALTGEANWQISTLGGPLLGVTGKRLYLESRDGDLFIVDRSTGQMLFDPRATHERAGVNIREFHLGPTNRLNDRIYIASKSGMLTCLRETGAVQPAPLRDPKQKPFGYIPPEGYPDRPVIPAAPLPNPDQPKPEAAAEAPK